MALPWAKKKLHLHTEARVPREAHEGSPLLMYYFV